MTATHKQDSSIHREFTFVWTILGTPQYAIQVAANPASVNTEIGQPVAITLSGTPQQFDSATSDYIAITPAPQVTFEATQALPAWLTLDNGTLSGTATTAGAYTIPIQGCFTPDQQAPVCATVVVTIDVLEASYQLKLADISDYRISPLDGLSVTPQATLQRLDPGSGVYVPVVNPTLKFSASGLPGGIGVNAATGEMTGWPEETGIFETAVTACFTTPAGTDICDTTEFVITVFDAFRVTLGPVADQQNTVGDLASVPLPILAERHSGDGQYAPMPRAEYTGSVQDLPEGVDWDSQTGSFVGQLAKAGIYRVHVEACLVLDKTVTDVCDVADFTWTVTAPGGEDVTPTPPPLTPTKPSVVTPTVSSVSAPRPMVASAAPSPAPKAVVTMLTHTGTNAADPIAIALTFLLMGAGTMAIRRRLRMSR